MMKVGKSGSDYRAFRSAMAITTMDAFVGFFVFVRNRKRRTERPHAEKICARAIMSRESFGN
jgi:hypothetical protein